MRSDVPRQFITFGSTNDLNYLMGVTGNRRFWPVAVGKIDLEGLARDRNQLWAEAALREAAGESIVLAEHHWEAAKAVQESRRVVHPIEQQLIDVVADREGIIRLDDLYAAIGLGGDVM